MSAAAAISGVAQLVLAKEIGPEQFGFYVFGTTLVTLSLAAAMLFGIPAVTIRLFVIAKDPVKRKHLCDWILKSSLKSSLVVSLMLAVIAYFTYETYGTSPVIAALMMAVTARSFCIGGILTATGRADVAARTTMIAPAAALVLTLILIMLGIVPGTGTNIMIGWAFGQIVALIMCQNALKTYFSRLPNVRKETPSKLISQWRGSAVAIVIASVLLSSMAGLDVVLIGIFIQSADVVGNYGMAIRITAIATIAVYSLWAAYLPALSEGAAEGGPIWKRNLLKTRLYATLASGICLVLAFVFLPAVTERFVPKFADAYWPAIILLSGLLIESITGPLNGILQAQGREKTVVITTGITLVFFLAAASLLIPTYGMIGAASCVAISKVLYSSALMWIHMKHQSNRHEQGRPCPT